MPKQILKRDKCLETWSLERIAHAILKALKASGIKIRFFQSDLHEKLK
jgi:ribonucleoside-triphosphate reductase